MFDNQLVSLSKITFLAILATSLGVFLLRFSERSMSSNEKLISVEFEVFGRVQGVFFRKHTEKQAKTLGVKGWCMNTSRDTVQGILEGNPVKIAEMKTWLQKTGSPQSRIEKAIFTNEHDIASYSFDSFGIKR